MTRRAPRLTGRGPRASRRVRSHCSRRVSRLRVLRCGAGPATHLWAQLPRDRRRGKLPKRWTRQRCPNARRSSRLAVLSTYARWARGSSACRSSTTQFRNTLVRDPRALNPVFLQLVRNLDPGQSPVIRIGGDSADWAWVPAPGITKPLGAKVTITPDLLRVLGALGTHLDARLILGLNLEADNVSVARAEAVAFVRSIGRAHVRAFEIGNEPELYPVLGWYHSHGQSVPGRRPGYDLGQVRAGISHVRRTPSEVASRRTIERVAYLDWRPRQLLGDSAACWVSSRFTAIRCSDVSSSRARRDSRRSASCSPVHHRSGLPIA